MTTYERNAESFERTIATFSLKPDQSFSEADTRVKIIDDILHNTLGWPETGPFVRREEHIHRGYIDYTLRTKNNFLIVEAKRVGKTFVLPSTISFQTKLSVKNILLKQSGVRLMYDQVTRYAHESGIMYCAITNGTQWLIFPGVRVDNCRLSSYFPYSFLWYGAAMS